MERPLSAVARTLEPLIVVSGSAGMSLWRKGSMLNYFGFRRNDFPPPGAFGSAIATDIRNQGIS